MAKSIKEKDTEKAEVGMSASMKQLKKNLPRVYGAGKTVTDVAGGTADFVKKGSNQIFFDYPNMAVGAIKNRVTTPPTNYLGQAVEASNREYARNVYNAPGYHQPRSDEPVIPKQQLKQEGEKGDIGLRVSREIEGAIPRREGKMLTNVPYPERTTGAYAYANGQDNSPLGGWNNQEDLLADSAKRKITGKLSNGRTYTYFLSPGETEPVIPQNKFTPAATGDPSQDSLNQMGVFMAEGKERNKARQNTAIALNNAANFKAQQEALTIQLRNKLAQYYMDENDYDYARSLLGNEGVIKNPPKNDWKPFTKKIYDDYGSVTGEDTQFYRSGTDIPAIFDPNAPTEPDPYRQALAEAKQVMQISPKYKEEVSKRLRAAFGDSFNEDDLTI